MRLARVTLAIAAVGLIGAGRTLWAQQGGQSGMFGSSGGSSMGSGFSPSPGHSLWWFNGQLPGTRLAIERDERDERLRAEHLRTEQFHRGRRRPGAAGRLLHRRYLGPADRKRLHRRRPVRRRPGHEPVVGRQRLLLDVLVGLGGPAPARRRNVRRNLRQRDGHERSGAVRPGHHPHPAHPGLRPPQGRRPADQFRTGAASDGPAGPALALSVPD